MKMVISADVARADAHLHVLFWFLMLIVKGNMA